MRFVLKRLALFVVALFGLSVVVFCSIAHSAWRCGLRDGRRPPPARTRGPPPRAPSPHGPDPTSNKRWLGGGGGGPGDFGTSILTGRSVTSLVGARASITFPLIILALLIALVIGLPLGCAAVLARSATVRAVFHVLAIVGGAVPALWGGLLLILLFGRGVGLLDVFPSQGFPLDGWGAPGSAISALVLPAVSVGIIVGASLMRYARGLRGFSQFRLHRYGTLVWHDAHSGGVACGIAVGNPAAGVCYRADLRFDGHWRDGHRKPVCVTGHRQRSCDRRGQPRPDCRAKRAVPAGRVLF